VQGAVLANILLPLFGNNLLLPLFGNEMPVSLVLTWSRHTPNFGLNETFVPHRVERDVV
jgi:hypothetical protein